MATEALRVGGGPAADSRAGTRCTHCGLDVPAGFVRDGTTEQFCCLGCETAWTLIRAGGLDQYYEIAEHGGVPVRSTGRTYEEFDHAAFHDLYVRTDASGLSRVELYLEGVHCAACVWLVERMPLLLDGVASAELNMRRALATVTWDAHQTPLSAVARRLDALGYPAHPFRGVRADAMRRAEDRSLLVNIGIAGAIAINVMLASLATYAGWFGGISVADERFFRWVSLALTTPAVFGPGRIFFRAAWGALRAHTLSMDVPIAVGLAAGYLQGATNTVTGNGPVYFDAVATLTFLLLVGRFLQQRGQRSAADAVELLYSLTPSEARVVDDDGTVREVPPEAVLPGMLLDVRSGDTLSADGVVEDGRSQLDVSLLTGESRPVSVAEGDDVFAGTTNLATPLRIRVRAAGESSRVARIMHMVEAGSTARAPVVVLANRVAAWFVGVILILAGVTWIGWQFVDPARAMDTAIALLVVTCPCALALATPLAVSSAVGRAARLGILVKSGAALEVLASPHRLFLDKTGTITEGTTALEWWSGEETARAAVLALEHGSTHPLAAGFRSAWPDVHAACATDVQHVIGGGVRAIVNGTPTVVGSPAFVALETGRAVPPQFVATAPLTPVVVAVGGAVVAGAGFGDPVRADAAAAIARLKALGWRVTILSGDDPAVVRHVASVVGVPDDEAIGAATPEAKLHRVREAAADGPVVMVGDGVNDAAAIAAASVGIGVHGGAEASLATADVYLGRPGLSALVTLVEGARRARNVIRRNVAFALGYNVVGIALAVSGVLNPMIASVLMPVASLTVVLASWRSHTFVEGDA